MKRSYEDKAVVGLLTPAGWTNVEPGTFVVPKTGWFAYKPPVPEQAGKQVTVYLREAALLAVRVDDALTSKPPPE